MLSTEVLCLLDWVVCERVGNVLIFLSVVGDVLEEGCLLICVMLCKLCVWTME